MKLVTCLECHDVVRLYPSQWRRCFCGAVEGRYLDDGVKAEIRGESAAAIGIDNYDYAKIVKSGGRAYTTRGEWFVLPVGDSSNVRRVK